MSENEKFPSHLLCVPDFADPDVELIGLPVQVVVQLTENSDETGS